MPKKFLLYAKIKNFRLQNCRLSFSNKFFLSAQNFKGEHLLNRPTATVKKTKKWWKFFKWRSAEISTKYITKFSVKFWIYGCMFQNYWRHFREKQFSTKNWKHRKSPILGNLCHCYFLLGNNLNVFIVRFNSYTVLFRIKFYIRLQNNKSFIE